MNDMLIDPDCVFICPKCHDEKKVTFLSVMNLRAFAVKIGNEPNCVTCSLPYELSHARFAMGSAMTKSVQSQELASAIWD